MHNIVKQLKIDNFSWSLRREQLFNSCRLAYLFHYHFSQGGHTPYAPDSCRQLYRLKQLRHTDGWLRGIFSDAVRYTFNCGQVHQDTQAAAEILQQHAFESFRHGWHECRLEEWRQDAKRTNIFEIYYAPQANMKVMFTDWLNRLEHWLQSFIANSLFDKLCQLDSLKWRQVSAPCSFDVDNTPVWINPVLAWRDHGYGTLLMLSHKHSDNLTSVETSMGSLLISQQSHLDLRTQEVMLYTPGDDDIFVQHPLPDEIKQCKMLIRQSSAEMQEFETAIAQNMPLSGQQSTACTNCNFKGICQENNFFIDGIQ